MLAAEHRLRSSQDFQRITREGQRSRHATVVVYAVPGSAEHSRVGLTVGKNIGNSVARHRVARRLRATLTPLVTAQVPILDVVVRALPASATATSLALKSDLEAAFNRLRSS
jgi:ribonuclease P protein component